MSESPESPATPEGKPETTPVTPDGVNAEGAKSEGAKAAPKANRRRQAYASIALLLGALGLWQSSRITWVTLYAESNNKFEKSRSPHVLGSDWSPWLVPVALTVVAAVVLIFVLNRLALRIVAVIVAIIGALCTVPALALLRSGDDSEFARKAVDLPDRFSVVAVLPEKWPGYLLLAAALCIVIGAVIMLSSANRPGMSSKYTSPAARRAELEKKVFAERERQRAASVDDDGAAELGAVNERMLWDSLDNGFDPTDPDEADDHGAQRRR